MFTRLESLIGNENLIKLKNTNVLIIGLGGVGGYAFEALVRSGIGSLTIVDNDVIELSNLNRQIITNQSNIGNLKVSEAKKRALNINPDVVINDLNIFVDDDNLDDLFKTKYDYVIDACDTVKTKILLIDYCLNNNLKIISCLGTAKKMDPSRLKIMNLKDTNYDPLAKHLRKHFKDKDVKVVCSDEKVKDIADLGSNSFVPATAGLLCASYVINDIIK
jgi:tRNA A37 threonylcarbamoyladenosine dehydratase